MPRPAETGTNKPYIIGGHPDASRYMVGGLFIKKQDIHLDEAGEDAEARLDPIMEDSLHRASRTAGSSHLGQLGFPTPSGMCAASSWADNRRLRDSESLTGTSTARIEAQLQRVEHGGNLCGAA